MVSPRVPWQPIFKTPEGLSLPLAEAFLLSGEQIRTGLHELREVPEPLIAFAYFPVARSNEECDAQEEKMDRRRG